MSARIAVRLRLSSYEAEALYWFLDLHHIVADRLRRRSLSRDGVALDKVEERLGAALEIWRSSLKMHRVAGVPRPAVVQPPEAEPAK